MPIGTDRPTALQVAPVAAIGQEPITPAVQDFMQSFRSGFITVDDITKRAQEAVVRPSELELRQKQNEQGILDTTTIRPQQRDLASKQLTAALDNQDIVAELARQKLKQDQQTQANAGAAIPPLSTVQGAAAAQTKIVGEAATAVTGTPEEQGATANEQQNRATIQEYAKVVGNVPATLPSPVKAAPFNTWLKTYHSEDSTSPSDEANKFLAAMPEGPAKKEVAAKMFEGLAKDPRIHADYEKYKQETAKHEIALTPSSPEYYAELRKQITDKQKQLGTEAATLKALPLVLENQAKVEAERPAQIQKGVSDLDADMQKDDVLKPVRLQLKAGQQVHDLATLPAPTNQSDLGLIYATVRALDPTSAVREGEVSMLQKGIAGYPRLKIYFNRLVGNPNGVLDPEIRANLDSLAQSQQKSAQTAALPILDKYYQRAVSGNLPLNLVFTNPELMLLINRGAGTPATAAPVAGAVVAPAAAGPSQKIQNGFLYQRQPDGTYQGVRKL